MKLVIPKKLAPGDSVAAFLPARAVDWNHLQYALKTLRKSGLKLSDLHAIGKHYFQYPLPDPERADLINEQLKEPNIAMLWAGRGGLGTLPILDKIQWFRLLENPKWIMGYSDITAILLHIWTNYGIVSIHGPLMYELKSEKDIDLLALTAKPPRYQWISPKPYIPGEATGYLIGGNLSMIYSLIGSASLPSHWHDVILFIEETDEYIYHIERMLISLDRAGILPAIKGLLVGTFTSIKDHEIPLGKDVQQLILDIAGKYSYPIGFGFQAGHQCNNLPFWHGYPYTLHITTEGAVILSPDH